MKLRQVKTFLSVKIYSFVITLNRLLNIKTGCACKGGLLFGCFLIFKAALWSFFVNKQKLFAFSVIHQNALCDSNSNKKKYPNVTS